MQSYEQNKTDTLRIAIQKSGRMCQDSLDFLYKTFGIKAKIEEGCLNYYDPQQDIKVFFCREKDIPKLVTDGIVDLGIAGMNTIKESGNSYDATVKLGFSKCRLSLAIRDDIFLFRPESFGGQVIATSYPKILEEYLDDNDIDAEVYELSGSVEAASALGVAMAICDLVETGTTLRQNNLREVCTVMQSEAMAILGDNYKSLNNVASKEMMKFNLNKFPFINNTKRSLALTLDRNCRVYN